MPTRRQLLAATATGAAMAALSSVMPHLALGGELATRVVPATGETLPVIGLGTSQTFNVNPADTQAMAALRAVMAAFESGGGRLIDTAPSYGYAQEVSGELAHGSPVADRLFLATKVSATGASAGMRQIENNFQALQARQIDLIQVHNLQDTATQLSNLRELKAQKRLRYVGVSHYRESAHDALIAVLQTEHLDFIQFNYSVGERNAQKRLLPLCAEKGVAVLINRPFAAGRLFDRVKGQPVPAWAMQELQVCSWAQLMLKFIVAHPAVTVVIPATSNPRYMQDNLMAGQGVLPSAQQCERIAQAFA
jgi:diketogulonate reductase-like aldo/keto reductase